MPALYALGQHDALHAAAQQLHADDRVFAFLDDVYIITTQSRARQAIDIVTERIASQAGVQTHLGKLEVWSPIAGAAPPGVAELSPTAWKGDAPDHENGLVILRAPLGHPAFAQAHADDRPSLARSRPATAPRRMQPSKCRANSSSSTLGSLGRCATGAPKKKPRNGSAPLHGAAARGAFSSRLLSGSCSGGPALGGRGMGRKARLDRGPSRQTSGAAG